MMMVMVARRAAASQIATAVCAMTSTAARGAILRLRIAVGICKKKDAYNIIHYICIYIIRTSEEVSEGRIDAEELAEHLLGGSEDERKAAHYVKVIKVLRIMMTGM